MNSPMMASDPNALQSNGTALFSTQHPLLRFLAKFISYVFHPVFVPLYVVLFMAYVHPYLFTAVGEWNKTRIVMMAALMFTFFPIVTVLLLKGLSFIDSIYLHTKKDRIIPLIACGIWYFWITYIWWNSSKMEDALPIPKEAVQLALATFIGSWIGLMANIKIKVSLHAIAVGVMVTLFITMAFSQDLNFGVWLSVALLVTGMVCSARFIVSDHSAMEVYGGLGIGIASMLIANWVI